MERRLEGRADGVRSVERAGLAPVELQAVTTATATLVIGTDAAGQPVTLPPEVLTHTMAILAKKGAGKTYTAGVIAEEFAKAGLPFVVLDPVGVHYGIRASRTGKRSAYS